MGDGTVEFLDVTGKVTKETYEVYKGFATVLDEIKKAGADGFQAAQDIPAALLGSLNSMSAAVNGLTEIPEELGALPEFVRANGYGSGDLGAALADTVKSLKAAKAESPEA